MAKHAGAAREMQRSTCAWAWLTLGSCSEKASSTVRSLAWPSGDMNQGWLTNVLGRSCRASGMEWLLVQGEVINCRASMPCALPALLRRGGDARSSRR